MPRQSKLTPAVERRVIALVRAGHSPTAAATMVGASRASMTRWKKADRAFRAALRKAAAMHERRLLARIENASRDKGHWKAAAWILERRYPERYAFRVHRAVEKEREAMLAVLRESMKPEAFTEVSVALLAAQQNARGSGREYQQRSARH